MATIQEVYIALFGRPADPIGYDYYVEATNDGADLSAVGDLSASPEYLDRFEGLSNIDIVSQLYRDMFGREPEAAGLLFYVNKLNSGESTPQSIAIEILDGASGVDADVIANKVVAAQRFTDSLDTAAEIQAYQGDAAADFGRAFLAGISDDEETIPSQADVDDALEDLVSQDSETPSGGDGLTFFLTAGNDQFVPNAALPELRTTSGDDIFEGDTAGDLASTDVLDGGAGVDTINAIVDNTANAPTLRSVERINLTTGNAASVFSLANATGAEVVRFDGVGAADDDLTLTGVAQSVKVVHGADDGDLVVTYNGAAGGGDAVTIGLDGAAAGSTFTAAGMETVAVDVMSDSETTLVLADAETITVSGEGDVDFTAITAANLVEFDAAAAKGNVTAVLGGDDLESVVTGSGSDSLTVTAGDVDLVIDSGAGADTVNFTANVPADVSDSTTATITLGAGNDTFILAGGGNLHADAETQAEIEASLITITGFVKGEDTIDLSAVFGAAFNPNAGAGGVNAAIADAEDLAEAIDALRTGGFTDAQFVFDGNLYLFETAGTDTLVELTGVTSLLTAADYTL